MHPLSLSMHVPKQDDKEVTAMMELRIAYDGNDLPKFERVGTPFVL